MNMLNQIKIGPRLALAFGCLLILMAIIAVAGWLGVNTVQAGLKTVYEDRTVALGQLSEINRLMLHNRILVKEMLSPNAEPQNPERLRSLASNIDAVSKLWSEYEATYLTPDEAQIAKEFAERRQQFVKEGLAPTRDLVLAGKYEEANAAYQSTLAPLEDKAEESLNR
ncbi:MAG TPA: MCP four helix bundle domain-containing protein, partial [Aquabacterium sp.]|nr:MCP four helix bundle domain-containing protein [Aquabacterium sp.]